VGVLKTSYSAMLRDDKLDESIPLPLLAMGLPLDIAGDDSSPGISEILLATSAISNDREYA
jgi:hypothetical protein